MVELKKPAIFDDKYVYFNKCKIKKYSSVLLHNRVDIFKTKYFWSNVVRLCPFVSSQNG